MRDMNLRDFVQAEMNNRHMSAREFARFVGVTHGTINNVLSFSDEHEPSLKFLIKLAQATNVDVCALIHLIYPDTERTVSGYSSLLANRIAELPPQTIEFIERMIMVSLAEELDKRRETDE